MKLNDLIEANFFETMKYHKRYGVIVILSKAEVLLITIIPVMTII